MDCDYKRLYGPYLSHLCYISLEILNLSLVLSNWKQVTFSSTVGLHIFVNILDHCDIIVLFILYIGMLFLILCFHIIVLVEDHMLD